MFTSCDTVISFASDGFQREEQDSVRHFADVGNENGQRKKPKKKVIFFSFLKNSLKTPFFEDAMLFAKLILSCSSAPFKQSPTHTSETLQDPRASIVEARAQCYQRSVVPLKPPSLPSSMSPSFTSQLCSGHLSTSPIPTLYTTLRNTPYSPVHSETHHTPLYTLKHTILPCTL